MNEKKSLFSDFELISDEKWRDQVISDLKGKDFESTLVWEDENGIKHQPYYRASDLNANPLFADIQKSQKKTAVWQLLQTFTINEKKVKKKVDNALQFGVDQVILEGVDNLEDVLSIFGKKYKGKISVKAKLNFLPNENLLKQFYLDPLGESLRSGENFKEQEDRLSRLFQKRLNQLETDRFLLIDSSIYKESGATIVQEMAMALQHATEYFDCLTDAGYTAEAVARSMAFKLAYGTSFFSEIAKGRAMRYLIQKLFKSYGVEEEAYTWGEGSSYYLADQDSYTNLLRATTMTMAAVLGNSDQVSTPSFDELAETQSTLGIRMAKNIQLILKEEAYFAQVRDMSAGSYYLESLTVKLAKEAWELFLSLEDKGGLVKMFQEGSLQEIISESHQNRVKAYDQGKTFLGVNQNLNPNSDVLKLKEMQATKGLRLKILAKEIKK